MAGTVFFSVSMLLDGFIAPESLGDLALKPIRAEPTPRATHLTYAVRER
jgi:hypothetical protein